MKSEKHLVLEVELRAVRALRASQNIGLIRAALDREEVLLAELANLDQENAGNVVPMAAEPSPEWKGAKS